MLSPLKQKIVDAGLVPNEYLLDISAALEDPAPRYPRSRMFRWPISVDRFEDRLTVCSHPMLFEPFVQRVSVMLATPIEIEPEPAGGCQGMSHHGVDLADDTHWRDLLKTRAYVNDRVIMRGVVIGMLHGRLATTNARSVLEALDVAEPSDRSAHALSAAGGFLRPGFIDANAGTNKPAAGKGKWTINLWSRRDPVGEVWAAVHGIEDGWFLKERSGSYHYMTAAGMSRHMGVPLP